MGIPFDYDYEVKSTISVITMAYRDKVFAENSSHFCKQNRELDQPLGSDKQECRSNWEEVQLPQSEMLDFPPLADIRANLDINEVRPYPAERYADKFVSWISALNSGSGERLSTEDKKILWSSYLNLVNNFLMVDGLYVVGLHDAYPWACDLKKGLMFDPSGVRVVPFHFMLACRFGFASISHSIPFETMQLFLVKYKERMAKSPLIADEFKQVLLKTESSRIEKGFYIGAIYGNLRVANGLFTRESEELYDDSGTGVQSILDVVNPDLEYLSNLEPDAMRIKKVLDRIGLFKCNLMPEPAKNRIIAVLHMAKAVNVDDSSFAPLKVINRGMFMRGSEYFLHFHLEGKSASETHELAKFFFDKGIQLNKSGRHDFEHYKKVRMGDQYLYLPKRDVPNPSDKFNDLNTQINNENIKLAAVAHQRRKSRTWLLNRLM